MPSIRKRRRRERRSTTDDQDRGGDRAGADFAQARGRLPGDDAVAAQREPRSSVFAKEGLPHRRVEEWKYTDLRALMRDAKPLAARPTPRPRRAPRPPARLLGDVEARRLVFVDGAFVAELSDLAGLEAGLTVGSLAEALADGDPALVDASRQARAGKRRCGCAQYRLDGRRRGDPHRRRLDHRAAAASVCSSPRKSRPRLSCARWSSSSAARAPC